MNVVVPAFDFNCCSRASSPLLEGVRSWHSRLCLLFVTAHCYHERKVKSFMSKDVQCNWCRAPHLLPLACDHGQLDKGRQIWPLY